MAERIVVALGGNALGSTPEKQLELVQNTAGVIADLVEQGYEVVIGHGNGPQVGMINLAMEFSANKGGGTPPMPFPECGAMTQGYIGYHLQQAIGRALREKGIKKSCAAVITQIVVDPDDPGFLNPTKPIGSFVAKEEAEAITAEKGYVFVEDARRGYRRVVPSPLPKRIVELELVEQLVDAGDVVITVGGGGIPVVETDDGLEGVDAVIDKDRACALLARELHADRLVILTAVERVCLHYRTPDERALESLTLQECERYMAAGEFPPGSMQPKIEACMEFVRASGGTALITSLEKAADALAVIAALVYIIYQIVRLFRGGEKGRRLYRTLVTLVSAGLTVYALFCLLWGVYYYADDFATRSGFVNEPVSTEQLASVTRYFARGANRYGVLVTRDENGLCASDRAEIIRKSPEVFAGTEKDYPALTGPALRAKGIVCSRVMSYLDFTGFFFPFTAEANVNMDSPRCDLAATVAHELSHQRGVAREQEANFTAVLASLRYGDADYAYSACLLAYTHLGNALYRADRAAWEEISAELSEDVLRDLSYRSAYWRQFDTPVQKASNTVYEGFLHSYDQTLGLKSYGACVDLLVNYYYELSLERPSP